MLNCILVVLHIYQIRKYFVKKMVFKCYIVKRNLISFNCFSVYSCNLHSPKFFIFTLFIAHDLKPSRKCKNICVITRRDKIMFDIVLLSPKTG